MTLSEGGYGGRNDKLCAALKLKGLSAVTATVLWSRES